MKQIKTVTHHKQCPEHYEALKRGDGYAAHMLYIPPTYKTWEQVSAEISSRELVDRHEAEMKRIESMPSELLDIELRCKIIGKKQ